MGEAVCIVGVGACTAVGLNSAATAAAVRAGIAGFHEHPFMINQLGEPYILAMVPAVAAGVFGVQRYVELVTLALNEALAPLIPLAIQKSKISVTLGLPELRPGLPGNLADALSAHIKSLGSERFSIGEIRAANKGHASGLMAMESAARSLLEGRCQFCLLGGVDSYIDPDTLDWIEDNGQLHMPDNAWGFIPGEAAGFCLLCSESVAKRYQLPVKAVLHSVATALEPNRIKTPTVCIGEGLSEAVYEAVRHLPKGQQISSVYNDMNGESYRAEEMGFMLSRLSSHFVDPSNFIAPASSWGDVGAAFGPLVMGLLAASVETRYSKGDYVLLWASSEAGDRGAVVLSAMGGKQWR